MFLTLSIGMVSIHSPLNVSAQNSALSQSGDSDAEQSTKQEQRTQQNGQIVSGESSILSGNNQICQTMQESDPLTEINDMCDIDRTNNPIPPNQDTAVLEITSILRANCIPYIYPCPQPDGFIGAGYKFNGEDEFRTFTPETDSPGGTDHIFIRMPVGAIFHVFAWGEIYFPWFYPERANIVGDCVVGEREVCVGTMGEQGAQVTVNFHYSRNL